MPPKRRAAKRRLNAEAELAAWSMLFACGHDYFQELPAIGVPTDPYSRPNRAAVAEAWRRLGARFLATPQEPHLTPCWALREFGEPGELGELGEPGGSHAG